MSRDSGLSSPWGSSDMNPCPQCKKHTRTAETGQKGDLRSHPLRPGKMGRDFELQPVVEVVSTASSPDRLLAASAVAGVVATALSHPLDTWAVHRMVDKRLQLNLATLYRGACVVSLAKSYVQRAAGRSCPKRLVWLALAPLDRAVAGIAPACLQAVVIYGAMLGTLRALVGCLLPALLCRELSGPIVQGSFGVMREHFGCVALLVCLFGLRCAGTSYSTIVSAMVAAVPEGLVKGPLETLKNLRQTNAKVSGRVLAAGTLGMLCRELPGNVAYFGAYELVRGSPREVMMREKAGKKEGLMQHPFVAGIAAASAFTVLVFPIDAMRAQMVVKNIPLTKDGLLQLRPTYQGVLPYWTRAVFLTGWLFSTYEYMK